MARVGVPNRVKVPSLSTDASRDLPAGKSARPDKAGRSTSLLRASPSPPPSPRGRGREDGRAYRVGTRPAGAQCAGWRPGMTHGRARPPVAPVKTEARALSRVPVPPLPPKRLSTAGRGRPWHIAVAPWAAYRSLQGLPSAETAACAPHRNNSRPGGAGRGTSLPQRLSGRSSSLRACASGTKAAGDGEQIDFGPFRRGG